MINFENEGREGRGIMVQIFSHRLDYIIFYLVTVINLLALTRWLHFSVSCDGMRMQRTMLTRDAEF